VNTIWPAVPTWVEVIRAVPKNAPRLPQAKPGGASNAMLQPGSL